MRTLKRTLIVSFQIFMVIMGYAQNANEKIMIELKNQSNEAFFINKLENYQEIIKKCKDYLLKDTSNNYVRYYLAYNQVNLLKLHESDSVLLKLFEQERKSLFANLNKLADIKGFESDSYLLFQKIYSGLSNASPNDRDFFGYLEKCYVYFWYAQRMDEENPRYYLQSGIWWLYKPEIYGGDVNYAIKILNKAFELFKKNQNNDIFKLDWGFFETCAYLAEAYIELNQYEEAKKLFDLIIKAHPNYSFVTNDLIPRLKLKMNKNMIQFPITMITDIDGNKYKTVKIGNQIWMAENLKTTKYSNGDTIVNITDTATWKNTKSGAYCWYKNDISNKEIKGALYNWYAAVDNRNICPIGWHVPSDEEFSVMINYLGGKNMAGTKMKEAGTTHWLKPNAWSDNSSGFSAIPAGYRSSDDGSFNSDNSNVTWWTTTQVKKTTAMNRWIVNRFRDALSDVYSKQGGFSIRCIKN